VTAPPRARRGLAERLASEILVCDGAMGTMLQAAGISFDRSLSELNRDRPHLVSEIHLAYLAAGASIIETNSFDANRYRLGRHGLGAQAGELNRAAAEIAVRARTDHGGDALIAGSIGPLVAPGVRAPYLNGEADDAIAEQVEALTAGGVDLLMFETFGDLEHLLAAVQVAQRTVDLPVVAQMTFLEDGRTITGDRPAAVARAFEDAGVAALGVNCALGPQGIGRILDELAASTSLPLSALPNAGLPTRVHGHFHYRANEEYFARSARQFVERGASIVGGCCGTTPQHIAAVANALAGPVDRAQRSGPGPAVVSRRDPPAAQPDRPPGPFAQKLAGGGLVVACELPTSVGADGHEAVEAASGLVQSGAEILVIPPARTSRPHIGPVPLGVLLSGQLSVEIVITATTWDKSILGLQADLLGAHAFDLRTVICRTGGPVPRGEYPNAAGMWDVDSIGLIELLRSLNRADDRGAVPSPSSFVIGASVNPNAADLKAELRRARRKIEAGAHFLVTQPVFDLGLLASFAAELGPPALPILLGVMPLRDFEHAEYLHHEVPDTHLPLAVLERMRRAGHDGVRAGREIAAELVAGALGMVQGLVVSPATLQPSETAETLRAVRAALGR
jgi:methionine synthase I (cobalamin-dependent)/5,10-methylenetetrahydrofolate reductase